MQFALMVAILALRETNQRYSLVTSAFFGEGIPSKKADSKPYSMLKNFMESIL